MDQRERDLRNRLGASPDDAEALRGLAELVSGERRRKQEAVDLWRRYVELAPPTQKPAALLALAGAQVEARREEEAVATLKRCISEAPEHAGAHDLLGELLRRAGRLEEAVVALERAVELEPESLRPRLALITCFDAMGRERDAERLLRDVQGRGGGDPAVAALVREIMHRRG